jgi:hypothetical protein
MLKALDEHATPDRLRQVGSGAMPIALDGHADARPLARRRASALSPRLFSSPSRFGRVDAIRRRGGLRRPFYEEHPARMFMLGLPELRMRILDPAAQRRFDDSEAAGDQ